MLIYGIKILLEIIYRTVHSKVDTRTIYDMLMLIGVNIKDLPIIIKDFQMNENYLMYLWRKK